MKLMSNISIIVRGSHVYATRKLAAYKINAAEESILMYLMGHSEANQESIAKYYMLDKGTVARSLYKLESKGFVVRKVNDNNQREKMITLTEQALDLKVVFNELLDEWRNVIYDGFNEEEVLAFEKAVSKITKNVMQLL